MVGADCLPRGRDCLLNSRGSEPTAQIRTKATAIVITSTESPVRQAQINIEMQPSAITPTAAMIFVFIGYSPGMYEITPSHGLLALAYSFLGMRPAR